MPLPGATWSSLPAGPIHPETRACLAFPGSNIGPSRRAVTDRRTTWCNPHRSIRKLGAPIDSEDIRVMVADVRLDGRAGNESGGRECCKHSDPLGTPFQKRACNVQST